MLNVEFANDKDEGAAEDPHVSMLDHNSRAGTRAVKQLLTVVAAVREHADRHSGISAPRRVSTAPTYQPNGVACPQRNRRGHMNSR